MKLLPAILVLILVPLANANSNNWEKISSNTEKGVTPFGIKEIVSNWEYRDIFDWVKRDALASLLVGEAVRVIDSVEVTLTKYKWVGETKCEESDDHRLFQSVFDAKICYEDEGYLCSRMISMIMDSDPCSDPYLYEAPNYQVERVPRK